jgi:hypothetical protein
MTEREMKLAKQAAATPETDAITFDPYPWNQNGPGRSHCPEVMYPCDDGSWVSADAARRLERQRDELMEALVELRDWYLENTGLPAAKANGAIAAVKGDHT